MNIAWKLYSENTVSTSLRQFLAGPKIVYVLAVLAMTFLQVLVNLKFHFLICFICKGLKNENFHYQTTSVQNKSNTCLLVL